ncbi:MAG TPA: YIP1 family protein [Bacteroidales bacterium]|nr:YIP1 family protein [Bacteroidales bacterium]
MDSNGFNFKSFIDETKRVLVNPKTYFSDVKEAPGMGNSIIKALIYGIIAGIFASLWSVSLMPLIWSIVGAFIGLFIGAVFILIVSSIAKGKTDFTIMTFVAATLMVVYPIQRLFGFIDSFSPFLGTLVSIVISLYSLYILFYALTEFLNADLKTSKIISFILAGLLIIFSFIGQKAKKYSSDLDYSSSTGNISEKAISNLQEKALKMAGADEEAISELSEMQKDLKDVADRAEKIAEEKKNETEEDKKIWSEKNIDLLGLNVEDRKIAESTWQKAGVLAENFKALGNEQSKDLNPEKINQMILDAGFEDLEKARDELKKIANSINFSFDLATSFYSLESTRTIEGEEAYKKEAKALGQKINKKGYSPDDLKAIDEHLEVTAPIAELLGRMSD